MINIVKVWNLGGFIMKIKTSIFVALAILLFFQGTVVFASSEQVIEENKYKVIELI